MNIRIFLFICLYALLFGCSDEPSVTDSTKDDNRNISKQSVEESPMLSIRPADAPVKSFITLRTADKSIRMSNIRWYINGNLDKSSKSTRFKTDKLFKGNIVHAVATVNNKEHNSNDIMISNSPPVIIRAELSPAVPDVTSRLTVKTKAEDADDDYISYKYNWLLNGKFAGEESFLETDFKRGDAIKVEVTPRDPDDAGNPVVLKSIILNAPPVFIEGRHEYNGQIYRYYISASDHDEDALTYSLLEGPEDMSIDSASGLITWKAGVDQAGIYDLKISISDNHGGEIHVPVTTVVGTQ